MGASAHCHLHCAYSTLRLVAVVSGVQDHSEAFDESVDMEQHEIFCCYDNHDIIFCLFQ